jgi:hypothetical protein
MQPAKSTQMVLDRPAILRHLSGQSVRFEPGVPVGVAPQLVKTAIGMGAKVVDGVTPDLIEATITINHGPVDPGERLEEITRVVALMIARNDREEWTGTGTPNINRVIELVGYKVQKSEVLQALMDARKQNAVEEVTGG